MFDFEKCKETEHLLLAMCPTPYEAVIEELERLLSKSVPSTKIVDFSVVQAPHWLTTVGPEDPAGKSVVSRIGVALEFQLLANSPGHGQLTVDGVFTWILAKPGHPDRRVQFWLDVGGMLAEFGNKGEMLSRFYSL